MVDSLFDVIRGLLRSILVDEEGLVTLGLLVVAWRWYTSSFLAPDVLISDERSLTRLEDAFSGVAMLVLFFLPV